MPIYTIEDTNRKVNIATEHVAVIYELPKINLCCLDNGQQIEVTDTQKDEILALIE